MIKDHAAGPATKEVEAAMLSAGVQMYQNAIFPSPQRLKITLGNTNLHENFGFEPWF